MSEIGEKIITQLNAADTGYVWVPTDFAHLGSRDVIDKTLQRMVQRGTLRRIDRGLYDKPQMNSLTKRPTSPDYRAVIEAVARRDNLRLLVDGMTAANDLGMTDAVPAHVTIYTDTRRRSIQLEKLTIEFKMAASSRLYWAGRPAMRLVQALRWLKDMLTLDDRHVQKRIRHILEDSVQGQRIQDDLAQGFNFLPSWMQDYLRPFIDASSLAWPGDRRPNTNIRS